jgi:RHS repeat-associated protein
MGIQNACTTRIRRQSPTNSFDAPARRRDDGDMGCRINHRPNTDGTRDYRLWPTFDANFNVTSLVTDQGKVVERYAYTPYGERIILNGSRNYADSGADPDGSAFTVDTNGSDVLYGGSGFQGLWFDAETGQWYQRRRYSSPVLQFTQRDPSGYGDGMNQYGYTGQAPLVSCPRSPRNK